ncbi:hypothetical protein F1737_10140 [Methanoplanus sp. FWC-SCC4]|uniref:Uncharacterized protein n=1 Tax=Methanochimaera problematica TaxID=2609417 RepID=A0AA97FEE2_9EURY|nr:hypothetical protein [Methanoplanus sp. FWC-SCC4]WOF17012.1 hypothetical protein F1737_10140 [Methanoplanus sp. FWC-SCC4]
MLVMLKNENGREEEVEMPDDSYLEVGDILENGSVIMSIRYPDDIEDDLIAMGFVEPDDEDYI